MADRYVLESGAPDGYLLEDGSGVLILEQQAGTFAVGGQQKQVVGFVAALSPGGPTVRSL